MKVAVSYSEGNALSRYSMNQLKLRPTSAHRRDVGEHGMYSVYIGLALLSLWRTLIRPFFCLQVATCAPCTNFPL